MPAKSVTLKDEIMFAEDALEKANRDRKRAERDAHLYDDPLDYSPSLKRELKITEENFKKAERKLARLMKRKGNPMPAKKRTASPAQLRALARGRAKLKAARRRTAKPKRKTRAKNPAPIPRGLMRKRALGSNLKAGTAKTKARGRLTNPPHYVIKTAEGKGYFDGAGWTASKQGAAQYMNKAKATTIATKVANATNKSVYVEAV